MRITGRPASSGADARRVAAWHDASFSSVFLEAEKHVGVLVERHGDNGMIVERVPTVTCASESPTPVTLKQARKTRDASEHSYVVSLFFIANEAFPGRVRGPLSTLKWIGRWCSGTRASLS